MKYLICGNYGVHNFGDECIAEGIENLLKQKDDTAQVVRMGKGMLLPYGIRSFVKSLFKWSLWRRPLLAIKSCDYFIVGGGGLFTDEERPLRGLFWALQGITALLVKKPVIVLGVSIGPMNTISRFFTQILFKRSKRVYCRDENSVKTARKLGAADALLCPDMAAYVDWSEVALSANTNNDKKSVLFVLRDFKNFTQNKIKLIVQSITQLHEKFGLKSIITSFDSHDKNDAKLLSTICALINNSNILSVHKPVESFASLSLLYSQSKFIVSMRYHAGIISLLYEVPFLSINYMKKSSHLWKSFPEILTIDFDYCLSELGVKLSYSIDSSSYRNQVKLASQSYKSQALAFAKIFKI